MPLDPLVRLVHRQSEWTKNAGCSPNDIHALKFSLPVSLQ